LRQHARAEAGRELLRLPGAVAHTVRGVLLGEVHQDGDLPEQRLEVAGSQAVGGDPPGQLNAQVQRTCGALLAVRAGGVHGVGQSPGAQQRGAQRGEGAAHHVVDCRRVRAIAGRQGRMQCRHLRVRQAPEGALADPAEHRREEHFLAGTLGGATHHHARLRRRVQGDGDAVQQATGDVGREPSGSEQGVEQAAGDADAAHGIEAEQGGSARNGGHRSALTA
jgi:hypothetical protein